MKITIRKGHHRPLIPSLGIFRKKNNFERVVTFHRSCAYSLQGEDMADINKLFGIGYSPNHHKESARFGWNYAPMEDRINIWSYCYVNGQRVNQYICSVPFEHPVFFRLYVSEYNKLYFFDVSWSLYKHTKSLKFNHEKNWKYWLWFYFGGNQKAPNKMSIDIKKV